MTTRRSALAVLIVLLLTAAACSSSSPSATTTDTASAADPGADNPTAGDTAATDAPPDDATDAVGSEDSYAGTEPAPEFPPGLDWLNTDRPLAMADLLGKVVVLDFWTYGCINCIHIIPDLERLEAEYPDELVVIGVHSAKFRQEGDTDNIRQVVLRYGLEHPVVNDNDFAVWSTWGAQAWPTVAVVDPAGNVVGAHSGEGVYPVIEPVIASLVREFDAAGTLDRTPLDIRLEREGLPQTILSFPGKVHADPAGDRIFIADTGHNRVVAARLSDGEITAIYGTGRPGFADGPVSGAAFDQPQGLALSGDGEHLYVADTGNHTIRDINLETGVVTTLAGTGEQGSYPPTGGPLPWVGLRSPWDVVVDGSTLYVAMAGSHQLWEVDLAANRAEPFAGNGRESTRNGPRLEAELAQPSGLVLDGAGRLYFADSESSSIRYAELGDEGEVDVLAGSDADLFTFGDEDGVGTAARLQHPLGVTYSDGTVIITDTYNSKLKKIDPTDGTVTTFLGGEAGWRDGPDPLFYEPGGLQAAGGVLYVADTNNHAVRVVEVASGETSTLILKGIERFAPPAGDRDYAGALVAMAPAEVAVGSGTLVLDVVLPPGHKVNDEAPSSVEWQVEGGGVGSVPATDLTGTTFPVEVPATFVAGEGTITADATIIWCATDAQSLCFVHQVRITAPVTAGDSGSDRIEFTHEIQLPEITN